MSSSHAEVQDPSPGTGPERRQRLKLEWYARLFVAVGAASIVLVAGYSLLVLVGMQDDMKRELGAVGFLMLVAVAVIPLLMVLASEQRRLIIVGTALLAVASAMCLGPMLAWYQQIRGDVPDLNLLERELVVEGLVGLCLGAVGVVGASICLVMSRTTPDR
jgi:hypothetical protein